MGHELWNLFLSQAIRKTLEETRGGDKWVSVQDNLRNLDVRLADPENHTDPTINAAYSFAEDCFFAYEHSDPPVVGASWDEAFARLEYVAGCLEQNRPIEDPEVMAYYRPPGPPRGCWGTLKDMFARARPG